MTQHLDEKYKRIYAHEENFAYTLAKNIVKKPDISVWMILLPVLFVHHIYRVNQYKAGVKSFAEGILLSKKKALDKTYKEISYGKQLSYGIKDYFPDVDLTAEQDKKLAQKQLAVLHILEAHYSALMHAEGESLPAMLRNTYGDANEYRDYFNRLTAAEKEINRHLREHVHTSEAAGGIIKAIEQHSERLREEETAFFFG